MEKRKHERTPLSMAVRVNRRQPAQVVDISRGGMRLRCEALLPGEKIGISIPSGTRTIPLFGQVRWAERGSASTGEVGVRISNAPFEYYQFLEDIFSFRKINRGLLLWPVLLTTVLALLLFFLF